jgi:hypothetical protein
MQTKVQASPAQALGKIFQRWIETEGKLPNSELVVIVSAYLYDSSGLYNVILSDEDRGTFIKRSEWLPHLQLPKKIEVEGQPGVTFWWTGPSVVSQMRVYYDSNGRIQTEEIFIRDFLEGK